MTLTLCILFALASLAGAALSWRYFRRTRAAIDNAPAAVRRNSVRATRDGGA